MNSKQYDIKLEIDADSVILRCPSGKHWTYKRDELPEHIYELAYRCLQDDAGLCQSISVSLKSAAKLAVVVLVMLFAVPCLAQETLQQYQANSLRGGYERFGSPTARWSTNPPKLYSSSGTYLGELSQSRYNPDSISNPYSRYGSRYSPTSVNNPYSPYGAYSTRPIWVYPSR